MKIFTILQVVGLRRHGSPTLLEPGEKSECYELINVDADEPGRVQGRPAARDIHELGSANTTSWPRNGSTA